MKVAFAVDTLRPTGIVRVVRNVAISLAENRDISVSIICTSWDKEFANYIPEHIAVYDLNIERFGRRKKYLRYVTALQTLFADYNPDVLVVSGMEHVPFYDLAGRILPNLKRFAWEHRNFMAGPKFRLEWFGKRLALKKWDGVLCITKKDYRQYCDYQGSTEHLHQIYNLTDFSAKKADYSENSMRIMSCGYLDHIKGYDMLLSVAEKVFREKPDWAWDIFGDGDLQDFLEKEIHLKGLENNLHLMGYDPNVQSKYGEYALFVLTSRAEGMGMVLIEAQKAGLPVVSFDILCGPSDVIEPDVNGYLIAPFDVDEMSRKIIELIEDCEKRKQFSAKSELHHSEFEKQVIIQKWREMLGLPG